MISDVCFGHGNVGKWLAYHILDIFSRSSQIFVQSTDVPSPYGKSNSFRRRVLLPELMQWGHAVGELSKTQHLLNSTSCEEIGGSYVFHCNESPVGTDSYLGLRVVAALNELIRT